MEFAEHRTTTMDATVSQPSATMDDTANQPPVTMATTATASQPPVTMATTATASQSPATMVATVSQSPATKGAPATTVASGNQLPAIVNQQPVNQNQVPAIPTVSIPLTAAPKPNPTCCMLFCAKYTESLGRYQLCFPLRYPNDDLVQSHNGMCAPCCPLSCSTVTDSHDWCECVCASMAFVVTAPFEMAYQTLACVMHCGGIC